MSSSVVPCQPCLIVNIPPQQHYAPNQPPVNAKIYPAPYSSARRRPPIKITEILKENPTLSFEFYPPRTRQGIPAVFRAIDRLAAFNPDFISVTYGAGGATQVFTEEIVTAVEEKTRLLPMAHLTCVGQTREEIHGVLTRLEQAGIENIIALRGDPPRGQSDFVPVKGGFAHASDLIRHISHNFDFDVAAACYPEGHLESPNLERDLEYAKLKLEMGASFLITQLFFDNRYFYSFMDRARKAGIDAPILAGILPILNTQQIRRFTALCGSTIPPDIDAKLDRLADDKDATREFGIEIATNQVRELLDWGVDGVHFYALNRSYSISKILTNLGFPQSPLLPRMSF